MSASEKLRALASPPLPFEPDFDKRYTEHHNLTLLLRNALPLIADLAEHAEQFALAYDERRASEFTDERYEEVLVALELLEKALDGSP